MGICALKRAVFLDRDGVINKVILVNGKAFSPKCFEEFEFIQGIESQIKRIKEAGFLVIVCTNQPDIARGKMCVREIEKMHSEIEYKLNVDDIFVCPHDDRDNCLCRKPKPGMLINAMKKYDINLKESFLIGDGVKDIETAGNAGCKGILIETSYNADIDFLNRTSSLSGAVDFIIKQTGEE